MKTTRSKPLPKRSQPRATAAKCKCLAEHPQRWIGPKELAQLLGVSRRSLYDGGAEARVLKHSATRFGKHLRWQLSWVLEWMERQQRDAAERARAMMLAEAQAAQPAASGKVLAMRPRGQTAEARELEAIRADLERRRAKWRTG